MAFISVRTQNEYEIIFCGSCNLTGHLFVYWLLINDTHAVMKTTNYHFPAILFLFIAIFMSSCRDKVFEEITYTANVPVYMSFSELRSAVKSTQARQLVHPGKIYFKDNYLFINEYGDGVHIIDNVDPSHPEPIAFLEIPGNYNMAVRGSILYADSYIDLVALDISDPANPVETGRVKNAFPNLLPPFDFNMPVYGVDFTKGVITGFEQKVVTELVEKEYGFPGGRITFDNMGVTSLGSNEVSVSPSQSAGIGGSMARFTINGQFLYAIHNDALKVFDLAGTDSIRTGAEIYLGRQVETIFPYNNHLFLGTTTGMLVYSLGNPSDPAYVSVFEHINSCDPVVIEGNYAYVTLRSGTQCNGFANQLDVVDISSVAHPFLVKSYPMYNPHGLGIDNHILFICDGDAGLKVYNAADPMNIHMNQIAHFQDIRTYDVIPWNGLLMLIGDDGLFQYDYSDLSDLRLISSIPVVEP